MITAITEDTGTSGSDRVTNDPTLVLSGTAEANAIVQLTRTGVGVIGSVTANASGAWAFDYTGTSLGRRLAQFHGYRDGCGGECQRGFRNLQCHCGPHRTGGPGDHGDHFGHRNQRKRPDHQ